jgi:hypothetical protein
MAISPVNNAIGQNGEVQDPAKCESGIGGFCFFQTYPGLLFGLI